MIIHLTVLLGLTAIAFTAYAYAEKIEVKRLNIEKITNIPIEILLSVNAFFIYLMSLGIGNETTDRRYFFYFLLATSIITILIRADVVLYYRKQYKKRRNLLKEMEILRVKLREETGSEYSIEELIEMIKRRVS